MIDFNMPEIVLLVVLAIIVFGPEKLPELARKLARILAYLRQIGNDARGQLRAELGDEYADIHLSDLNPRTLVAKHLLSSEEVSDLRDLRDDALSSGQLVRDTLQEASGSTRAPEAAPARSRRDPDADAAAEGTFVSAQGGAVAWRSVPFDPEAT